MSKKTFESVELQQTFCTIEFSKNNPRGKFQWMRKIHPTMAMREDNTISIIYPDEEVVIRTGKVIHNIPLCNVRGTNTKVVMLMESHWDIITAQEAKLNAITHNTNNCQPVVLVRNRR